MWNCHPVLIKWPLQQPSLRTRSSLVLQVFLWYQLPAPAPPASLFVKEANWLWNLMKFKDSLVYSVIGPLISFQHKKKWKLYQNHQLFKMTESSVIKMKSVALFTFVKVKFTKHPKLSLFEITWQSIRWKKKNQLKTNTKSLKNAACMSAWNSTGPPTLDKFNLCWDNSVHITASSPLMAGGDLGPCWYT